MLPLTCQIFQRENHFLISLWTLKYQAGAAEELQADKVMVQCSKFWPLTGTFESNGTLIKSEKVITQSSTLPRQDFYSTTGMLSRRNIILPSGTFIWTLITKTRACPREMSRTHIRSFPFCFPFTISLSTSYHTSPYSHTEITVFSIWNIKRGNLETNSHHDRGRPTGLNSVDILWLQNEQLVYFLPVVTHMSVRG